MIISNIIKGIDNRFKEVTVFYKKVKMLITTKEITLYKVENEIKEQLAEDNERWIQFCNKLFEKDCMPDRIFNELLKKDYPIEEISFIWYEDEFSEDQIEEFMEKSIMICPMNDNKEIAFIFDEKESKKVEVHIV